MVATSVGLLWNIHAQDAPAGEQLQQLHEEAAQAPPLGVRLDLQLPAVQHRALACRATVIGCSHKHLPSLAAQLLRHITYSFVTFTYKGARTFHLIAEVHIRQPLLWPVVDLSRYKLDVLHRSVNLM